MTRTWLILRAFLGLVLPGHRGERLRVSFERLGGAWLKFGQFMSFRRDVFSAEFCDALSALQGQSGGEPGAYGRSVVVGSIGQQAFDTAFARFDDAPIAAASIGQVHRAVLAGGRHVAVKVLRPGARESYASDLRLIARIAWGLDWFARRLCLPDMVGEMATVIAEELDLRFEADHMRRMAKMLKKHGLGVPAVHSHLCSGEVLVMDWIDGRTLGDLMADPDGELWLASHGLTYEMVGKRLLRSLERQVLEEKLFHGDMHPKNVMVSAAGALVLIDFGTCASTDLRFLEGFRRFLNGLADRDYSQAADYYCGLAILSRRHLGRKIAELLRGDKYPSLRRQLVRVMQAWAQRTKIAALPFAQKSVNQLSSDLMAIILKEGGAMRWEWFRITRAFTTVETVIGHIWPGVDHVKELRRYRRKAAQREDLRPIRPIQKVNTIGRLLERADEFTSSDNARIRMRSVTEGFPL